MTQEEALNILKTGRNVYLTGAAGSGKTHVLNKYIAYLRDRGVVTAVTASTGIAATHLGGMTIHSWSGMGIKDDLDDFDMEMLTQKEHLWKRYKKTKVLILDEISMIHPRMFNALDRLSKAMKGSGEPFGGMQVVLSGDFFQLPPIVRGGGETAYADSAEAWSTMDVRVCYLKEQHRQNDDALLSILDEIRDGEISTQSFERLQGTKSAKGGGHATPTRLYTHNVDVDAVNEKELEKLPGEETTYKMTSKGRANLVSTLCKSILAPELLKLKEDAAVMFVKNNFEEGYVNGTLGRVVGFENEMPVVETFSGKKINVAHATWEVEDDGKILASAEQLPLRLAWAITVHKSQGMSLDAAEIDLSKSFVPGQGYVALSRVRNLEGLRLLGFNNMALSIDPYVLELNKGLMDDSSKWSRVIQKFDEKDFKKMHEDFITKSGGTNDKKEIEKNMATAAKDLEPKISSHAKTYALVKDGKSLRDISKDRAMTVGTIISHLEKIKAEGHGKDLASYEPRPSDMKAIKEAFKSQKDDKLAPAHRKLKGKYSYEDLRLARLFI